MPPALRLERRAQRSLRRVLALPEGVPLALVRPAGGRGGRTFTVEVAGERLAVLRAVPQRRRLLRMIEATRRLERLGVPVPRVLWSDSSRLGRWWQGAYLLLEEHLAGQTLAETADRAAALARLATLLARLHSEKRPEWGTFGRRKRRGYARYRLSHAGAALRALCRGGTLGQPEAKEVAGRLAAWEGILDRIGEFHLIHNDLHFANVIVGPGGEVNLIDLYRLRFDRREREVAALSAKIEDIEPRQRERFEEEYRLQAGALDPQLQRFEEAVSALARWAALSGRARLGGPGEERGGLGRLAEVWGERFRARLVSP
jgi:Ser/Thr protein kinase RdoA (MazF antagonist)